MLGGANPNVAAAAEFLGAVFAAAAANGGWEDAEGVNENVGAGAGAGTPDF